MAVINLAQVASPSAPSASTDNVFIDTSGNLSVQKPDGNILTLAAAGTYTLTIPATGTAALLGTAQTFSAAQTFSNRLVAPGMQPASDGTAALTLTDAGGTPVLTIDTTNDKVIAAGDVFASNDTRGLLVRTTGAYAGVADHFNTTLAAGWAWQTDAGVFATPATVSLATYASYLSAYHSSSARHFLAQSVGTTANMIARITATNAGYSGIRIDDGSNANYIELRMGAGSGGAFYRSLTAASMLAGTETLTTLADNLPNATYTMRLTRGAAALQFWYHQDFVPVLALTVSGTSWSSARAGLTMSGASGSTAALLTDWALWY